MSAHIVVSESQSVEPNLLIISDLHLGEDIRPDDADHPPGDMDLVAVGLYLVSRIVILDATTLEVRARLRICPTLRAMDFDPVTRALYYGDGCGLHRVRGLEVFSR